MTSSERPQTKPATEAASTAPSLDQTAIDPAADDPAKTKIMRGDEPAGSVILNDPAPSAPPPDSTPTPSTGKVTQLGDFKLVKKLGQGGMGAVYLAVQGSLDRQVALKTLSKELAKRPDFVQRFLRECRAMARLQHPNVVQVYAADSVQGIHFVAIEYIDGQSMQNWMDQLKTLSIGDALHVVLVAAEALKHAHDVNMIHRDIKPDNILVTQKGVVKLADFGLAKAMDEDVSMTASGVGMGTPLYMPPEQARDAKRVDQRTDIYALGGTLYYFLTGQLPFQGSNTLELLTAKEKGRFTPARKLNPDIPERLDLMIDKMLAKEPQQRYANCNELIRDLSGLELDNPQLEFIGTPDAARVVRTPGVARGRTTAAAQAAGRAATPAASPPADVWHVRHTNAQGRPAVSKLSTEQVRRGIKSGALDLKAKASKTATGEFLPLAQFVEFASGMQALAIKETADQRGRNMKGIYAQLDKQDRRRKQWRWFKQKFGGIVGLIVWLAILAAVGYGGWWAWQTYGPQ